MVSIQGPSKIESVGKACARMDHIKWNPRSEKKDGYDMGAG